MSQVHLLRTIVLTVILVGCANTSGESDTGARSTQTALEGNAPVGAVDSAVITSDPSESLPTVVVAPQWPSTSEVSIWFVEVMLHHCGFNPITIRGDVWEVPEETGPFDATNAPSEWVGRGTIQRSDDGASLHYEDESGISLEFVPDDGRDPLCD